MKKVSIDFAPRSLRRTLSCITPAALGFAVLALGLCLSVGYGAWHYLQESRAYEAQLVAARARIRAPVPVPVAMRRPAMSESQAAAVNAAIMQLNLPWRALNAAVLGATPATVALLSLEPDARKRTLRITAEARGSDDMIGYVEQLQRQDWFASVSLTRHEVNEQDPNRPIRFQIEAQWRTR
jgi:hypothetical protein